MKARPETVKAPEQKQSETDATTQPPLVKRKIVQFGTGARLRVDFVLNSQELIGTIVTVKGWAKTARIQGNGSFAFIELNDGSSVKNLQLVVDGAIPHFDKISGTGFSLTACGTVVASPGQKQAVELHVKDPALHSFDVIGLCDPATYPLSKKKHSLEFLRSIGHLRARSNTIGAVARVRNALAFATHKFFQERGFLYVHTPIVTASDCEGAGEMFSVSTLPSQKPLPLTPTGELDYSKDFFGRQAFLTVSGQLAVENYSMGLSDVYTFGPTFRAEDSHTTRHLAEFWMIEPELAWADLEDNMECAESYLKACITYCLETIPDDLDFFEKTYEPGLIARLQNILQGPFARCNYTEAVSLVQASGREFKEQVNWGDDLKAEHERYICEEVFKGPTIVYNYPKTLKAFYMRVNDDDATVQAMDILIPKIGEVVGGSVREERLEKLDEMLAFKQLDPQLYWWYRELRRYGSVPHAGFGLGFERLVMMMTGLENIRDVIPYPRWPGHAEF
jgi:asparaginyl-tRNA synthetase